jgi:hypothetical protein
VSPGYEIRVRVAKLKGNAAFVEQATCTTAVGAGLLAIAAPRFN